MWTYRFLCFVLFLAGVWFSGSVVASSKNCIFVRLLAKNRYLLSDDLYFSITIFRIEFVFFFIFVSFCLIWSVLWCWCAFVLLITCAQCTFWKEFAFCIFGFNECHLVGVECWMLILVKLEIQIKCAYAHTCRKAADTLITIFNKSATEPKYLFQPILFSFVFLLLKHTI